MGRESIDHDVLDTVLSQQQGVHVQGWSISSATPPATRDQISRALTAWLAEVITPPTDDMALTGYTVTLRLVLPTTDSVQAVWARSTTPFPATVLPTVQQELAVKVAQLYVPQEYGPLQLEVVVLSYAALAAALAAAGGTPLAMVAAQLRDQVPAPTETWAWMDAEATDEPDDAQVAQFRVGPPYPAPPGRGFLRWLSASAWEQRPAGLQWLRDRLLAWYLDRIIAPRRRSAEVAGIGRVQTWMAPATTADTILAWFEDLLALTANPYQGEFDRYLFWIVPCGADEWAQVQAWPPSQRLPKARIRGQWMGRREEWWQEGRAALRAAATAPHQGLQLVAWCLGDTYLAAMGITPQRKGHAAEDAAVIAESRAD